MDIIMPQLGETVEEGTVVSWLKVVGDSITKGELIFEVETDKVTMEIPAPADGTLMSIIIDEGETVDVGTILAILAVEGEAASAENAQEDNSEKSADPMEAPARKSDTSKVYNKSAGDRTRLSPAVRRLAAEHNIDISLVEGSGEDGRISRKDIEEYIKGSGSQSALSGITVIPFSRIRQKTAERMVLSKATSPHVFQGVEVRFNKVEEVRSAHKASWKKEHGFSLTYLPFIARATAIALKEFAHLNAHLDGDKLLVHSQVNLGIAVDLGLDGLMVPVVKQADTKTLTELALAIRDFADRAKEGKLIPDELTQATYTISNSGSFGTFFTAPIINQPQVAIMSTDGVSKKPVVVESESGDSIVIAPVGIIAQSFDHRAIDGAYSAAFLKSLKDLLETHDWSKEL